ncbi:MAG: MogA/MoaB family molybdenum cofactor biosynthesis protein, partial [Candidatus Aureabacteria bacterium]|nr:MogA/MoaB family molybdenum cofactor biosynthesis protein [Candidatus Auribacterota bacterium]
MSDSAAAGGRRDGCVDAIVRVLPKGRAAVVWSVIVPDEVNAIRDAVHEMIAGGEIDLVLTAGGTGLGPRDVTPEAVAALIEKNVPGIPERMRGEGAKTTPTAILSRAIAGTRRASLIITLPGSPKGAAECVSAVWPARPHALEILRGEGRECAGKHHTQNAKCKVKNISCNMHNAKG